jgi:transcriptional regulator
MDKANPLWRSLSPDKDVFISFFGPNCYFSPSHYKTSPRAPTWLYTAVHISGRPKLITDGDKLIDIVSDLSSKMEKADSGWQVSDIAEYRDKLIPLIIGFEINVSESTSQIRMGQTNGMQDKAAMKEALRNGSASEQAVANLIERLSL